MLAGMSITTKWPSLTDQLDLATELHGQRGPEKVANWLESQLDLIGSVDFARTFSDHIELPGITSLDYAHRHIHTQRGELVGGIRFYNRDIHRPFIEVVAHSFHDIDALGDCVKAEWSMFYPPRMRLRIKPGRLQGDDIVLDQSIHVGRYDKMQAPDGRVHLDVPHDVDEAIEMVATRYNNLSDTQPELANNISPAAPDDLRRWHAHGQLRAIRTGDITVGILAIAPGSIGWITGDEIQEEIIAAPHNGHGYAASAQRSWAAHVATDPTGFLIGTIDLHNYASRTSAVRAGRRRVLDDVLISLDPRV